MAGRKSRGRAPTDGAWLRAMGGRGWFAPGGRMSEAGKDYAVLAALSTREEAEIVASALRAGGIDAFIGSSNHADTHWGYIIALGGLQVLTPAARLGEARRLMSDRMKDLANDGDGEPTPRRDHDKLWLIIGGWFLLGWFVSIVQMAMLADDHSALHEQENMQAAFERMLQKN